MQHRSWVPSNHVHQILAMATDALPPQDATALAEDSGSNLTPTSIFLLNVDPLYLAEFEEEAGLMAGCSCHISYCSGCSLSVIIILLFILLSCVLICDYFYVSYYVMAAQISL